MGRLDSLMFMVTVCEAYSWTYQEYQAQPQFFLTAIKEKMVRDNKERERELRKTKRG